MTKQDFISKFVEDLKQEEVALTLKEAEKVYKVFLNTIVSSVAAGEKVSLNGFGVFESVQRAARTCRNPQTGAQMEVPAKTVPKFKVAAAFKSAVSGK